MPISRRLFCTLFLLSSLAFGLGSPHVVGATEASVRELSSLGATQPTDSASVMAVVKGFKRALLDGDSTKAISFLHGNLSVFESRQAENLAEYRNGHLAADMAYLKTVTQTTTRETLTISGDLAVFTSLYTSAGMSRGRQVNSNGTETMILSRTPAGWKVLHVHW